MRSLRIMLLQYKKEEFDDLGEMKKQTAQLRDEIRRLGAGKCQCD